MLIERYRSHMEIRNYSAQTIYSRCASLKLLLRFLEEIGQDDLAAVTTATLRDFQRWLFYMPTIHGIARSIAHQNRVLTAVKGLYGCLYVDGLLARNPAAPLEYAREPQTLPRNILTPQEARRIIEAPDIQTVIGYRDRTILEVFYSTGMRRGELMSLTVGDVNLEEELLRINGGKGAKDRVVPLTTVAVSFLESYIHGIRPKLLAGKTTNGLFLSLRARPIGRTALGKIVTKYARLARIKKRVTCHLWRHSCATHLLKNKANLRHVQELLGHRNLSTTERYLHLTITELKEAHRRHHPREKTRHDG